MTSHQYLTAREAATELGISLSTLYAYVSRGLVRSESTGRSRTRRYSLEDIQSLKARREQRKDPQKVVNQALHLGVPVMDSAITLISDGRLYYRGRDALALATAHRAEQIAWFIWTGQLVEPAAPPVSPPRFTRLRAARRAVSDLLPIDAFQVLLPLAAVDDLAAYDLRPAAVVQTGMRILRLMAAIAVRQEPSTRDIAETLQSAWVPDDPHVVESLNAALILCADHELNVSAFTARCVASAGSTPYAVVFAGLAALQGARHGGHTERSEALLQEASSPVGARVAIASRLRRGEAIPGFGQVLYPEGDPRGAALVRLATETRPTSAAVEVGHAIVDEVLNVIGEHPNIDFGLAMLAQALSLPPGGGLGLFAIGRTIGWIGHAIEQYQQGRIIRPRARYVGDPP